MGNKRKDNFKDSIENVFKSGTDAACKAARDSLVASVREFLKAKTCAVKGHYETLTGMFEAYREWAGKYFVPGTSDSDFVFAVGRNNCTIGVVTKDSLFEHIEQVVVYNIVLLSDEGCSEVINVAQSKADGTDGVIKKGGTKNDGQ